MQVKPKTAYRAAHAALLTAAAGASAVAIVAAGGPLAVEEPRTLPVVPLPSAEADADASLRLVATDLGRPLQKPVLDSAPKAVPPPAPPPRPAAVRVPATLVGVIRGGGRSVAFFRPQAGRGPETVAVRVGDRLPGLQAFTVSAIDRDAVVLEGPAGEVRVPVPGRDRIVEERAVGSETRP